MTEMIVTPGDSQTPRLQRLTRVLTAAQSFVLHCEEGPDQGRRLDRFNRALLAIEDAQGALKVLWANNRDRAEFADLLDLAWRYQLESAPPEHAVKFAA